MTAERAPARGRYDRRAMRWQRVAAQRERLLLAAALAQITNESTVARVLTIAGVGRATFYEYFDDMEHASCAVRESATARMQLALARATQSTRDARESVQESLWVLCREWFGCVTRSPVILLSALSMPHGSLSAPAAVFRTALLRRVSGAAQNDENGVVSTLMLAAAAQALAMEVARALVPAALAAPGVRADALSVEAALQGLGSSVLRWASTAKFG